jgi:hypothetical protein
MDLKVFKISSYQANIKNKANDSFKVNLSEIAAAITCSKANIISEQ